MSHAAPHQGRKPVLPCVDVGAVRQEFFRDFLLQQILGVNPANLFRSAIGSATQMSMGAPSRTILV